MNQVKIKVSSKFLPERSNPLKSKFFFSYAVNIHNTANKTVQLLSRYWRITDGNGNSEEIYGPGVVGQTPVIKPMESFKYSSFCGIVTPVGFMEGRYRMNDGRKEVDVLIDAFQLTANEYLN